MRFWEGKFHHPQQPQVQWQSITCFWVCWTTWLLATFWNFTFPWTFIWTVNPNLQEVTSNIPSRVVSQTYLKPWSFQRWTVHSLEIQLKLPTLSFKINICPSKKSLKHVLRQPLSLLTIAQMLNHLAETLFCQSPCVRAGGKSPVNLHEPKTKGAQATLCRMLLQNTSKHHSNSFWFGEPHRKDLFLKDWDVKLPK